MGSRSSSSRYPDGYPLRTLGECGLAARLSDVVSAPLGQAGPNLQVKGRGRAEVLEHDADRTYAITLKHRERTHMRWPRAAPARSG